jgi:hypothetical protein
MAEYEEYAVKTSGDLRPCECIEALIAITREEDIKKVG